MTDTPEKTPEEIIAEAAAAVQDAEPVEAAEAPAAVDPSPEAALDPQDAPELSQNSTEEPELSQDLTEEPEAAPVYNPNALRGVPAGPAPHPRTV